MKTVRALPFKIAGLFLLVLAGTGEREVAAQTGQRPLEFLRALGERGYYDLAELYLNRLESGPDLPRELSEALPYEKAVLLLRSARTERDLIRREQQLEKARLQLQRFLEASPDHPQAAHAGSEFGKILLERGRVALIGSQLPANRARKRQLLVEARARFEEAQTKLSQAIEGYESQMRGLTQRINASSKENPETLAARDEVDRHVMQAKLDRAVARYELAQTYEAKESPFNEHLKRAAEAFEKLHVEYRTQLVGLYGRMWQGRCFQELGEPAKALGFYRELLTGVEQNQAPDTIAPLERFRDNVLYFRFVSLNDPSRRDYEVVAAEAEPWREQNARAALQTEVGLGVSLELARAYEEIGKQKATDSREQKQFFQRAGRLAGEISRYDGQHQPIALAMAQRLGARTRTADPEGFDDLLTAAREALEDGFAAGGEEGDTAEEAARSEFLSAARFARGALASVRSGTSKGDVNEARLVLCHANYQLGRYYEAAVLGEFLAKEYPESGRAENAAAVALAAYFEEYQRTENADRDTDLSHLADVAALITQQWPDSPEAARAGMTLGGVYQRQGEPSEAAKWFLAVDQDSPRYAEAQQKAGMAYWDAYLRAARLPRERRPDRETLEEYQRQAQQHLQRGLAGLPASQRGNDLSFTTAASRLSMAQIYLEGNEYDRALPILEQLTRWVEPTGDAGPTVNPQFASETYKAALRAYVGVRDLEAAEATMARIEALDTAGDAGVVQVYQRLGQELENEVNRRRELGDEAGLNQMLDAFAAFLDRVAQRETGQTFETLAWTGDAYFRLAEGLDAENAGSDNRARARKFFGKAAAVFERILALETQEPAGRASDQNFQAIRLRLARCLRRQGGFAEALQRVAEVLRTNSRAVDAQVEAAYVYQDWAQAEGGHWNQAITGGLPVERNGKTSNLVWGWGTLGRLLQPAATPGSAYYALWHEVRYNQAYCLYKRALDASNRRERSRLLELAQRDLRFTTRLSDDHGGAEWQGKFERLRRDIDQALAR